MSVPDLPPPGGQSPRRSRPYAGVHRPRVDPVRYVAGLLLWQGVVWLVLTSAGIGWWLAALPAALGQGSSRERVLWAGAQLVALAIGACAGTGEIAMACALRGRPRWLFRQAARLHGLTVASGMVLVAVAVMIIGSILELIVLNGAYLVARAVRSWARKRRTYGAHGRRWQLEGPRPQPCHASWRVDSTR